MSCYIVSNEHLSAIVTYACRNNLRAGWKNPSYIYQPGQDQELVNILDAANVKSFNSRYPGEDTPEGNSTYEVGALYRPIEIVKLIEGLAYQCDEWEGFDTSDAKKVLDDIQGHAIQHIPGYDAAPWSI